MLAFSCETSLFQKRWVIAEDDISSYEKSRWSQFYSKGQENSSYFIFSPSQMFLTYGFWSISRNGATRWEVFSHRTKESHEMHASAIPNLWNYYCIGCLLSTGTHCPVGVPSSGAQCPPLLSAAACHWFYHTLMLLLCWTTCSSKIHKAT